MGVTIASSSLPLQQVRPAGAATGFNKALILYIINQYPSSCNAKKKERTVVIWIICYFAGAGVCKNRPEATKQASDSTCEGAGGGRGGRAKTNLFWPGGRKGWMPRAGAPKGERETLRGLFTHFFFFFFFFYTDTWNRGVWAHVTISDCDECDDNLPFSLLSWIFFPERHILS